MGNTGSQPPSKTHPVTCACARARAGDSVGDFTQWNGAFIESKLVLGLRVAFENDL